MITIVKAPRISIFAVLVTLIGAGCARTPQQKEARYLANGKERMLKKDYPRAVLEFRNAVQAMPSDAEAYFRLASAYLAMNNLVGAVGNLRKATELNPYHADAQVQLAGMMALSGVKEAHQEGEKRMLSILKVAPGNMDALDALALNEFQLGKQQEAERQLQEVLAKFPEHVKSSVALAQMHLRTHDLAGAEQVLQKAAQQAPRSVEVLTALGGVQLASGRGLDAEKQFRAALSIDSKFALAWLGLAAAQARQGQQDQVDQTYRAIANLPDKGYRHFHASYLFQRGRRDEAVKEFEDLAKRFPDDRELRTRLVAAYTLTNRFPNAEKILSAALQSNPEDSDALLQRSSLLLRSRRVDEAQKDLVQASKFQSDSPRAHFLLSQVYQARGDTGRQRQELNDALRYAPSFLPARLELAQVLLENNTPRDAIAVLDEAPKEQKAILGYVITRNWALLAMDSQAEARSWVDRALQVSREPDVLLQDAVLKLKKHDYTGARSSAEEALQRVPDDRRAMRVIGASYIGQKQPTEAMRALEQHAAQYPQLGAVQQFLGEWMISFGQPEKARAAFAAAKVADPHSAAAALELAKLDINAGKPDFARQALAQIVASDSANLEARQLLGSLEVKSGNYAAAREQFQKILEADPHNVAALNNLAYILTNYIESTDVALGYAQKAREAAPENLDAEGTLGWVFYRKGLYRQALNQLQDASAKDGSSATPNAAIRKYHLAMTYFRLGDRNRGTTALVAALKIDPKLPEARMATAVVRGTPER